MKTDYNSSIPQAATERGLTPYRREGDQVWLRKTQCHLEGKIVGERSYGHRDELLMETPLLDGLKHGIAYRWDENGRLELAEPYCHGKPHGTATQWGPDGTVIGTYTLVHGTGFDIWRHQREDGSIYISEIHSLQDGLPHRFEWWLNPDQCSVHIECHWHRGELHGIKRGWNASGRLRRGSPEYYVGGQRVTKLEYLKRCSKDPSLPAFRAADNRPSRAFSRDVSELLTSPPATSGSS